ncbi:glycosyltransferase [Acetoanaerobium noterae]|uniref:glycosyltransferase n=1 Tax=Acetoanaerobium noterae TaxID=745369 RepID=UPI0032420BE1
MNNILLVFPYNVTNLKDFEEIVNKFETENFIIHYFEGINNENLFVDGLLYLVDNIKKSYSDINKIVILSNLRELIFSWYRCFNNLIDDFIYFIDANNYSFIKKDEHYSFFRALSNFNNIEDEVLQGNIYINLDIFNYNRIYDFLIFNSNFKYFKDFRKYSFNKEYIKIVEDKIYSFEEREYYFGDFNYKSSKYYISSNTQSINLYDFNLINNLIENIHFVKYVLIELYKKPQTLELQNFLKILFQRLGEKLKIEDRECILEEIIEYLNNVFIEFREKIYMLSLCVLLKSEKDILAQTLMSTLINDNKHIKYHYSILYNMLFYQSLCGMKIYDEIYLHRRFEVEKISNYFNEKVSIKSKANRKKFSGIIEQKKTFRIAIHYDQLLSLSHSPTKLCLDLAKNFKKFYPNFKIKIFIEDNLIISGKEVIYPNHYSSVSSFLCRTEHNEYLKDYDIDIYYSNSEKNKLERTKDFVNQIKKFNPDVIFTTSDLSIAREFLYKMYPIVFSTNGGYNFSTLADAYIYYGEEQKKEVVDINNKLDIFPNEKIQVLKFGVQLKTIEKKYYRSDYNINNNDFVMITVGNRLDVELTNEFIDFICSFLNNKVKARWLIVGPKKNSYLELKYKNLLDEGRIIKISYENHLESLYNICDIYIDSKRQGGGMSIASAMNEGLPIIVFSDSTHGRIWIGEENCVESVEAYNDLLDSMYEDIAFREMIGIKMKERIKLFSMENYIHNIVGVIYDVLR